MSMKNTWLLMFLGLQITAVAAQAQKDWQFEVGPTAEISRSNWAKLTQGEELARGKAVEFAPKPAYELTADENDAYDLTDGKLSERMDDRIWFNKDAAGWHFSTGTESAGGVLLKVDLGSMQPVGQIAIRLLGGAEQGVLTLPNAIEFLGSLDGEKFYSLQHMKRLMPAEREQSDFKTAFFVPEEGKAFMHPFFSREAVNARYIAIRVTPLSDVHTDQISVLKAAPGVKVKELTSYPESDVLTKGFVVKPKLGSFVVTTNAVTPNWLLAQAYGDDNKSTNAYGFRLELPKGLRLLPESKPEFTETATATSRRYEFKKVALSSSAAEGRQPLFITTAPGEKMATGAKAKFTGIINGVDSHTLEYTVQLVAIPEVPRHMTETFDIGLGWVNEWEERAWPDYLKNLRKMGFGEVTAFPMWWGVKDGKMPPEGEKNFAFIREAKKQGYGIVLQDSPFHQMMALVKASAASMSEKDTAEIYNQVDGKPGKHPNLLYRGTYFQNEIKRIAELVSIVQPDQLHLDIELWWEAANEAKNDPRTVEVWKKSGKEWDDFIGDAGTEMIAEVVKAARAAVPQKPFKIGLYHSDPKNKVMDGVYHWNKLYPKYLDIAQPSLYVQGQTAIVADRIRQNYNATGKRNIVPWLTAGTYGEFDPKRNETIVLETILNGASGITYYYYPDFDPMDFYYHAKALATLGQFPDLIKTGKPMPFTGDNKELHYTSFGNDKEALLLVGNYGGSPKTKATLPLALKGAKKATIVGGKALPIRNGQIALEVPAGEFRLVHLKG